MSRSLLSLALVVLAALLTQGSTFVQDSNDLSGSESKCSKLCRFRHAYSQSGFLKCLTQNCQDASDDVFTGYRGARPEPRCAFGCRKKHDVSGLGYTTCVNRCPLSHFDDDLSEDDMMPLTPLSTPLSLCIKRCSTGGGPFVGACYTACSRKHKDDELADSSSILSKCSRSCRFRNAYKWNEYTRCMKRCLDAHANDDDHLFARKGARLWHRYLAMRDDDELAEQDDDTRFKAVYKANWQPNW